MLDQAARLRELAAAYRSQAATGFRRRTRAIAVTSGKGGVGKTNISVNLAQGLVGAGKEVILLDADLGLANADILLGTVPPYHLGHLVRGERDILELIHRTPTKINLIAGGSGVNELANLPEEQLSAFITALSRLDGHADYLILDTGAGLSQTVLQFVLAADLVLMVTTPEPTALADAYAMIKALVSRRQGLDIKLVINQAERLEEAEVAAERIIVTARDFLGVKVEHLGTIPRDPYVWQAVRNQVPFTVSFPGAPASRAIEAMVRRLLGAAAEPVPRAKALGFFERLSQLFGRRGTSAL